MGKSPQLLSQRTPSWILQQFYIGLWSQELVTGRSLQNFFKFLVYSVRKVNVRNVKLNIFLPFEMYDLNLCDYFHNSFVLER